MSSYLTAEQVAQMLRGINPSRVTHRDGMSHLEAYDVRAHLNRVLGFARWSADLTDLACLFETLGQNQSGRDIVSTGYRATVRLTVCASDGTQLATYTEAATGDAINFPINKRADAADFAIKTAESQALKRCAVNLGDQWGASLYRSGSTAPLIGRTLVMPAGATKDESVDHDAPPVIPEGDTLGGRSGLTPTLSEPVEPPLAAPGSAPSGQESLPSPEGATASAEDVAAQTAAHVEHLREQAIALLSHTKPKEALQKLTRLQLDAAKHKIMNETTTSPKGAEMSVQVLLNEVLSMLSRAS